MVPSAAQLLLLLGAIGPARAIQGSASVPLHGYIWYVADYGDNCDTACASGALAARVLDGACGVSSRGVLLLPHPIADTSEGLLLAMTIRAVPW